MLFSSNIFLFLFLPIIIFGYFVLPSKYRNYFLLICSLFFYAWGEPKFVFIMIGSIVGNYIFGLLVDKFRNTGGIKVIMTLCVLMNMGVLFVFKYLNFAIQNLNLLFHIGIQQTNIALPIGISFFTFQAMSYVIDVYRNDVKVQKNPFYLGLYISFFPQLIAGPIVRYSTIEEQINNRQITLEGFSSGVKRFITGISKKVLIANNMALIADLAFSITNFYKLTVAMSWLGAVAYSFQILFDFSGYSDMAIGMGQMFGFTFLENFNYPYISKSVSEFWRRWHISLGTWFRDYVYFPLGGSHVNSKVRLVFNLFVVWFLTGIWHGANWTFIVWGIMYFVLIAMEKLFIKPEKIKSSLRIWLYRIFTLAMVLFGWIIFRSDNIEAAFKYILAMFGLLGNGLINAGAIYYFKENWIFFLGAIMLSTPFFPWIKDKIFVGDKAQVIEYAGIVWYLFVFLLSVAFITIGSHNPFIYFNF